MKVGFIGAGKVGCTLGKYLCVNGIKITGYYSKSEDSSKAASIFTSSKQYLNLKEFINDSDTIFITTPDRSISFVWNQIKEFSIQNKLICHCSGSLSSNIFNDIDKYGAYGYSIHPMFAISDKYNSYKNLKEAFITIEGSNKYIKDLECLFSKMNNKVLILKNQDKRAYHLANVMASNLVIGLINNANRYLQMYGFDNKQSIDALYELINFNIRNIKEKGLVESLTGPVERNDVETVKKHYEVLLQDDREMYRILSKELLELAKQKNKNKDYKNLELFLGEEI